MDDPSEKTLWCGNLSQNITEDLLFELFLQAGPLEKVTLPREKDGKIRSYAFIMFKHSISVNYAVSLLNGTNLNGRPLRLKPRSSSIESPQTNRIISPNSSPNSRIQRTNVSINQFPQIYANQNLIIDNERQFLIQRSGLAQKMLMRGTEFHPYIQQRNNYPYWH